MMPLPEKLDDKIKECLDRAIEELENGQGILHDDVMDETKKRFPQYFESITKEQNLEIKYGLEQLDRGEKDSLGRGFKKNIQP